MRQTKMVSVDNMKEIFLNRLRIPSLDQMDIAFVCKKYVISVPNMVHYEKLLDDLAAITRMKFSSADESK